MRDRNCIEISHADNLFGLSKQELYEAFCAGELDCFTDAVFVGDLSKVFIDMKSQNNKDAFNKLLFQKELLYGLSSDNFNKSKTCQRIKLAWYFAPKTREAFQELASSDLKILEILKHRFLSTDLVDDASEIAENLVADSEKKSHKSKGDEDSLLYKHQTISDEDMYLKDFFEKFWNTVGFEEYSEALSKAESLLNIPVDSIQDKELQSLVAKTAHTANRDFLPYT